MAAMLWPPPARGQVDEADAWQVAGWESQREGDGQDEDLTQEVQEAWVGTLLQRTLGELFN